MKEEGIIFIAVVIILAAIMISQQSQTINLSPLTISYSECYKKCLKDSEPLPLKFPISCEKAAGCQSKGCAREKCSVKEIKKCEKIKTEYKSCIDTRAQMEEERNKKIEKNKENCKEPCNCASGITLCGLRCYNSTTEQCCGGAGSKTPSKTNPKSKICSLRVDWGKPIDCYLDSRNVLHGGNSEYLCIESWKIPCGKSYCKESIEEKCIVRLTRNQITHEITGSEEVCLSKGEVLCNDKSKICNTLAGARCEDDIDKESRCLMSWQKLCGNEICDTRTEKCIKKDNVKTCVEK
jgi:hypothetical protein